jgi:hypothetical protein
MFIFNLNTKSLYSQIIYYSIYYGIWLVLTQPLAPYCLLFLLATSYFLYQLFSLLGEPAFLLMVRIPIHSCPWFAFNCPPFATSPTLTHPIDQVTIFT